jgi:hypothetical protein
MGSTKEATSPFIKALGGGRYTGVRKDWNSKELCSHFFGFRFSARLIEEESLLTLHGPM